MTERIQCPVCRFAHIPRDMETCPQCDSDLACFQLLDRLSDKPPEPAPSSPESATQDKSTFEDISDDRDTSALNSNDPSGRHQRLVPLALAALAILLAVFFTFFAYRLSTVENLLQRQQSALMDLVISVPSLEDDPQKKNQLLKPIRRQEIFVGEMDPIPDRKKKTHIAIKPILIISEALETDPGSKGIGIIME
jgi:hypothetical protein